MMYNKDIVVSLIYILSEEASCNAKTGSLLKLQDIAADKVELIICSEDKSLTDDAAAQFAKWPNVRISESYDIKAASVLHILAVWLNILSPCMDINSQYRQRNMKAKT